jgi:hypothetical protein
LDHRPSNRDLSPTDFHLFSAMMVHLSGHRFTSDENVELATITWLTQEGMSSMRSVWQTTSRYGQFSTTMGTVMKNFEPLKHSLRIVRCVY